MDSDMPFAEVETIDELVERQIGGQRMTTLLLVSFALLGLILAVVGIYGVISFLVAQRKQELAVRMALGASRTDILWLVVKQGLGMASIGAALGLLGAWTAQKVAGQFLFDISPVDILTFPCAAVFLLAVAAVASVIPARRATRVDPMIALRDE
jgi:ABC-type antimicrobial peptide transport system permease subunit